MTGRCRHLTKTVSLCKYATREALASDIDKVATTSNRRLLRQMPSLYSTIIVCKNALTRLQDGMKSTINQELKSFVPDLNKSSGVSTHVDSIPKNVPLTKLKKTPHSRMKATNVLLAESLIRADEI